MIVLTDPKCIEAANVWISTKLETAADVEPAALLIAVLYEWKLLMIERHKLTSLPETARAAEVHHA